ncbi:MAG: hypothetical protein QF464_14230, partial [Myxococcota bacterium]|nr:hypothetical protein [Myxococcota bacterium]
HLYEKDATGTFRAVIGGGRGLTDGPIEEAKLMGAYGIHGTDTRIYIADTLGHAIRVIESSNVLTLAGNGERGLVNGAGSDARFGHPYDLAVGADGTIYVADTSNHAIRALTVNADFTSVQVSTVAGGSARGMADGNGSSARFHTPVAVAVLPDGDLLVADQGNNRIRRVTPGGAVSTWVGGRYGYGVGRGTDAALGFVTGLAVATDGMVYVSDRTVPGVLSVNPDGFVTPITGAGEGGGTGNASGSHFSGPAGLAVTADGTLLVADMKLGRVRVLDRCSGGGVDSDACAGMSCDVMKFLDPACMDADAQTICEAAAPASAAPKKLLVVRKNGNNTRSVVQVDPNTGTEAVAALLSDKDLGTYGGHGHVADGRHFRMVGPAIINNNLAALFVSLDAKTNETTEISWYGQAHGLEVTSSGDLVWVYKQGSTHKFFRRMKPSVGDNATPWDGISQSLKDTDITGFTDGSKSDVWGDVYYLQAKSGSVEYVYKFDVNTGEQLGRIETPASPVNPGVQTPLNGWAMPGKHTVLFAEWDAGSNQTKLYRWDMTSDSVTALGVVGDLWSGVGIGYTAIDRGTGTLVILGAVSFNGK